MFAADSALTGLKANNEEKNKVTSSITYSYFPQSCICMTLFSLQY